MSTSTVEPKVIPKDVHLCSYEHASWTSSTRDGVVCNCPLPILLIHVLLITVLCCIPTVIILCRGVRYYNLY